MHCVSEESRALAIHMPKPLPVRQHLPVDFRLLTPLKYPCGGGDAAQGVEGELVEG